MITIKPISKKDAAAKVYLVSNLSQLNSKEIAKEELSYLKDTLKDDFEWKMINRLKEQIYVVKVSSKSTDQNQEKTRKAGAEIAKSVNGFKQKEVSVYDKTKGEDYLISVSEGMALANYQFLKYFKDAKKKTNSLKSIYTQSMQLLKPPFGRVTW